MSDDLLRPEDATLLHAQDPSAPLQIGALALFETGPLRDAGGALRICAIRRHVASRLAGVPRFRRRIVGPFLGMGAPAWIDDPDFDVADHVHLATLPAPGGPAQVRAMIAGLLERPLDPRRPLWEIWVIDGVADDRVAVVPKVSHVMADGTALLGFTLALLDVSAESPEPPDDGAGGAGAQGGGGAAGGASGTAEVPARPGARSTPPVAPALARAALARAGRQATLAAGALGALRRPWRVAAAGVGLARSAAGARPAPPTPMNRPVGRRRDMTWLRQPLPELRAAARSLGASLNDVVLAAVAGALRNAAAGSADGAGPRDMRTIVPVSTHGRAPGGAMENRFSVLMAELPVSIDDPCERVRRVHAEMQRRKGSVGLAVGSLLLSASDLAPAWLIRLLAPTILGRQPIANLAVTNLPGTDRPLYLLGARMTEAYPFVTVIGNISLIVGVLSYGDGLGVGVTVDPDVVGDVDGFTAALARSFGELVAVGRAVTPGSTSAGRRPPGRSAR